MSDLEAVKSLHLEMAGWTILSIKPSMYPESLAEFHLQLGEDDPVKGLQAQRKVVLVCATDIGAWIQDVYDPCKPHERKPKLGLTFPQLVFQIWDYLLENDCVGNFDPETSKPLPEPSEYLVTLESTPAFTCPKTGRTWVLSQAMIDAHPKHLGSAPTRAKVAHLIATESPGDVFRVLGIKET